MKTNKMNAIFANKSEYNDLSPLTDQRPLSTLIYAGKYRIMDFPLSSIVDAGINKVFTLTNEEKVRSYFDHLGGGKEWGLDTIGSYDYLEFYQGIMQQQARGEDYFADLISFLKTSGNPYTVFISNKMIGSFDLEAILHFHRESNNKITPVFKRVKCNNIAPDDEIFVLNEDNSIVKTENSIDVVDDSQRDEYNLSLNIFIIDSDWLIAKLERAQRSGISNDLAKRLAEYAGEYHSSAYEYTGYLRNIHDMKSFYDANMDMLDKKKRDSLLSGNQKIITRIRNEVGTYFTDDSDARNSMFATGSRVAGKVLNSIVSRRAIIEHNADVENSVIMTNCKIGEGSKVEYAILDKNVVVEDNVTIRGTKDNPVIVTKGHTIDQDIIND